MTAFLVVQRARRLLLVLREAKRLELSALHKKRVQALEFEVERGEASDRDITRLEDEVRIFLQDLRSSVTGRETIFQHKAPARCGASFVAATNLRPAIEWDG